MELDVVGTLAAAPLGVAPGIEDGVVIITSDSRRHVVKKLVGQDKPIAEWTRAKKDKLSHAVVATTSGVLVAVQDSRNLVAWRMQRSQDLASRPSLTARVAKSVTSLLPLHQQAGGVLAVCSDGQLLVHDDALLLLSNEPSSGVPVWATSTLDGVVVVSRRSGTKDDDDADAGVVHVLDVTGTAVRQFAIPDGLRGASNFAFDFHTDTLCILSSAARTLRYVTMRGARVRSLGPAWDRSTSVVVASVAPGYFAVIGVATAQGRAIVCDASHGSVVASQRLDVDSEPQLVWPLAAGGAIVHFSSNVLGMVSAPHLSAATLASVLGRDGGSAWQTYLQPWHATEPQVYLGSMVDVVDAFAAPSASAVQEQIRQSLVAAAAEESEVLAKLLDRKATQTPAAFLKVFSAYVDAAAHSVAAVVRSDEPATPRTGRKRGFEHASSRRPWHSLSPRFVTLVARRCVEQDGFDEPLLQLINTNLVSLQQVPKLISSILERHQLRLLEAVFIHVHDLDERSIVAVIQYLMRESRAGSRLDAYVKRRGKQDKRMLPIPGDSALDVMLYMVLSSPRNDVLLQAALRILIMDDVLTLLALLLKWCLRHCVTLESTLRKQAQARIPTFAQTVDWLILVLDAHFTQLVLVDEAHPLLRTLADTVNKQLLLCDRAEPLRGMLSTLSTGKTLPTPDIPDYCIEMLTI